MSGGHAPVPARKVVTGRRTGAFTGYHPSRKMGTLIAFESLLEADALTVLETDRTVVAFGTQPVRFRWRDEASRQRSYTPDLLVTTARGRTFREVKPHRRYARDPCLGGRRDRIEAECAALGARFEVWTDADIRREPRLSNARAILAEGRRVGDAWAEARVRAALPDCRTAGMLAATTGLPLSRALRAVMRLAALGEAGIDVEVPFGPLTQIQGGRRTMSGSPQRYAKGDHLRITEGDGAAHLWRVRERAGKGWRLEPVGGGDTRTLSDAEITRMRRQIEHYPQNQSGLKPDQQELLDRTFESNKEEARVEAQRRAHYVRRADRLREEGLPLDEAFERASAEIFAENGAAWQAEDELAEKEREKERAKRRRLSPEMLKKRPKPRQPLAAPRPSTIESWFHPWIAVGKDIRILIPLTVKRGNRTPRLKGREACIYEHMRQYVEHEFLSDRHPSLSSVHKLLNEELNDKGLKVSYKCLWNFLLKNYSDYEEVKRRYGWRKAHVQTGVFKRRRPPAKPLDEIEVDHSLLDMIVVNDQSGRRLGRPWLTLALDRCTRMVLGVHVSFEVPSAASLQRCLAHAFWPKDLSGLGLSNPWPTEGVPRLVYCDNGKDFHSATLKLSELAMGFTIVHQPPRQPWLKGMVERIFGRIGIQVFDLQEGKTFSNPTKRGEYNSVGRAKMTLSELKENLLRYFVDDYHVNYHEGLKGIPLEEWQRHAEVDRVEGVRTYEEIRRLMGTVFHKPITNVGVKLHGLVYYHDDLKELRSRRGGTRKRFQVRADPFDLGEIELLDEETGRWLLLPCDRPELSVGISLHQARTNERRARKLAAGEKLTDAYLAEGQRLEAEEAAAALGDTEAKTTAAWAARYALENGTFFTPLVGQPRPANDAAPNLPQREGGTRGASEGEGADTAPEERAEEPGTADSDVQATMLAMMAQWTRRSA